MFFDACPKDSFFFKGISVFKFYVQTSGIINSEFESCTKLRSRVPSLSLYESYLLLGGDSFLTKKITPIPGEMIQFDEHNMFQIGWFNHQLVCKF